MTQRHAWKTMALAYYTPEDGRTKFQNYLVTTYSVCEAIRGLSYKGKISSDVFELMTSDTHKSMSARKGELDYAYESGDDVNPANDVLRADFCWLQYVRLKYGGV